MDKENRTNSQAPSLDDLMCSMMTTSRMIQRYIEVQIAKKDMPAKLSGPRMGVLFAVQKANTIRMGDLATRLKVTPRTITDLVDALEREDMLIRKPDPDDRRAILLELTPSAKNCFDKVYNTRTTVMEDIFKPLDSTERQQLNQLLQKLQTGTISEEFAEEPCFLDKD